MARFLKYFSAIFFILIAILIIIPFIIPTNSYKEKIIEEVKKATDRDLSIDGNLSFSLIPRPTVKMENFKLSSIAGASSPTFIEAKSASVSLELTPLFTGKIVVPSIKLEQPQINLEELKDGRKSWEFAKGNSNNENTPAPQKQKVALTLPFPISEIIINNGKLEYLKDTKATSIEDINLDLNIQDLKGPIKYTANFLTSGHKIDIKGTVKELGEIIPLTLEIDALGGKINLAGNVDSNTNSFTGKLNLNGNFSKFLADDSPKGLQKDVKIGGNLYADAQKINLDSLDLNMGAIKGAGNLYYQIESGLGQLKLNINPGKIDISLNTGKISSDNLESKISVHANALNLLLKALEIDTEKLPPIINQEFTFNTTGNYKLGELTFKDLSFNLGKSSLKGLLAINNNDDKATYSYDLKTDNAIAFASVLGVSLPLNLAESRIQGETIKIGEKIQTNTNVFAAAANVNVNGDVNVGKVIKPNLNIKASGKNFAYTVQQLFQTNPLPAAGNFAIVAKIAGDLSQVINLNLAPSNIVMKNDNINFKGDSSINFSGKKPKVSSNLTISTINLSNFLAANNNTSSANQGKVRQSEQNNVTDTNASPWSRDNIDLKVLQTFEGDFNLNLQKLIKDSLVFDTISINAQVANGVLKINSLNGNLYGGKLESNGSLSSQSGQPMNFKATLKDAHLKNIVSNYKQFKITQGTFNLNMDLKSNGNNPYQYIQNLSGLANFQGENGRVSGFDLQKVTNNLTQANNLQGVVNILNSSFSGGETNFKTLKGTLNFNNGIATLSDFNLDADGAKADATGNVDLPKYVLDVVTNINVNNLPSFKVKFYGRVDNPQHQLDTSALQKDFAKKVFNNVIDSVSKGKTKPEDILKGIIGGSENNNDNAPANSSPPAQNSKNSVNDLVNKGLQNLFKK